MPIALTRKPSENLHSTGNIFVAVAEFQWLTVAIKMRSEVGENTLTMSVSDTGPKLVT